MNQKLLRSKITIKISPKAIKKLKAHFTWLFSYDFRAEPHVNGQSTKLPTSQGRLSTSASLPNTLQQRVWEGSGSREPGLT
jgi:hypothetical protein